MITCKEMARRIASDEVADAPLLQRFGMHIHLLMCRYCRRYAAQLCAIGESVRRMLRSGDADPATLDRLERAILGPSPGKPVGEGKNRVDKGM